MEIFIYDRKLDSYLIYYLIRNKMTISNALNYPYKSLFTGNRIYTGGGNDSTGDGSIYAPYATLSHAMSVASNGAVIVVLQNISDIGFPWKRDVFVIGQGSPTITISTGSTITLHSSFSTSGSLVWKDINFTVTNPITWDFHSFTNTNTYFISPINTTLSVNGGMSSADLNIIGLINGSGGASVRFLPQNLQTYNDIVGSLCNITLDFGTISIIDIGSTLGSMTHA